MSETELPETAPPSGPVLFLRAVEPASVRLAATVIRPEGEAAPVLATADGEIAAEMIHSAAGVVVWRYEFALPVAPDTGFTLDGTPHPVATELGGDLRIAYVACNGQEHGDLDRPVASRNAMWRRLVEQHAAEPFHLLLHGGDQIYADEVTNAHPLARDWPERWPERLDDAQEAEIAEALGQAFFLRYAVQQAQGGYGEALASIPSLAMWDDHDICDGWGSLRPEALDSPLGVLLFKAARDAFLLFQFGCRPDEVPEICVSREGPSLDWALKLPGLDIVAPDLRSTRRPDRVMDQNAWRDLDTVLGNAGPGRVLVMSSVPALGPRLSLVERVMRLTKRMERYEDDLRDQWQSYAHREEWKRFLAALVAVDDRAETDVTVLSGEIHLATRGTMKVEDGVLHQLVASGISHPAPHRAYAFGLAALARLGEGPLADHPIRMKPLPGKRTIYTAERNYLVLTRTEEEWTACWELEKSGPTPPMSI
ncbi:PhoD-like phosphatase [Palleronia aestuarii]|uniref:PhoD-like phosphatase n=1 Tax=Palleronia aestuarii TaxID=568105 RepID=A0A2W7N909_9RHOB|nr:alkaline phosphatase D family protein [Palleronia aestuarii]PZX16520.1 PhoD-like phosphatase [Palleronia aestuarii]